MIPLERTLITSHFVIANSLVFFANTNDAPVNKFDGNEKKNKSAQDKKVPLNSRFSVM